MHTIGVSDTQAISIRSDPQAVLDLVGDPLQLPRWAPAFARAVRPDGEHWVVDSDGTDLRVRVRVSRELGTVDILAVEALDGMERGAFARVIANGTGSEMLFTVIFPDGVQDGDRDAQRATIGQELRTVRALCEGAGAGAADRR